MAANETHLLGPFIGDVTNSKANIWLQLCNLGPGEIRSVSVTLHEQIVDAPFSHTGTLNASDYDLGVGLVTFEGLKPNTTYYYRLWQDSAQSARLDLQGLTDKNLHFKTLPEHITKGQLDFLLMSCHNPETSKDDGADGFAVWAQMPEILRENKEVRFALLAGDQIYGDEIEVAVRNEPDLRQRQELYLGVYRKFWSNINYRKVLCSLPAYLMWDDHDITDGWGSRDDSFEGDSSIFEPEWRGLFQAAQSVFTQMQASRNPEPLSKDYESGFDFCFRIGRAGFAVPDLRTNRNVREHRIMLPQQLAAIRQWVTRNKDHLDVFFFVSTVVFSHGNPVIERSILKYWIYVLRLVSWLGKFRLLKKLLSRFDTNIGDLRDDINDSWGSDDNREEADTVLDFLFDLQNLPSVDEGVPVVILSGDIHTPGYSTLYSADPKHTERAVIPHIVATPVAYAPFSWVGEAIFRHLTQTVELGAKGTYTSQVSHHFCYRNVVVVSFRKFAGDKESEKQLKVKYYLEGYPEPQIMLFDLNRSSHREDIHWPKPQPKSPLP